MASKRGNLFIAEHLNGSDPGFYLLSHTGAPPAKRINFCFYFEFRFPTAKLLPMNCTAGSATRLDFTIKLKCCGCSERQRSSK